MKSLSFYEQQHFQKLLQQEGQIKYLFDDFVRRVSPLLSKWSNHGGDRVWVKNLRVENAIDKELSELHNSLLNFITDSTVQSWNRGNRKADDLVKGYIEGMSVSEALRERMFARNADALNALLRRKDNNGFTVSDRVWKVADGLKDNLEYYLSSGVSAGRPATLIGQDVRQLLNEPDRRFRRVRDEEGKLVMSKPMADYHPGQGVYRSAYKNALRLTATQTNIGYRQADHDRWQKMDFVLGIEIKRSNNHKGPCKICDAMVGKYPKGFLFTGFHPFCICFAVPVMMDQEEFANFLLNEKKPRASIICTIPAGARAFIADHPQMEQSFVFRDNRAYFAENSLSSLLAKAGKLGIRTERYEQALAHGQYPEMLIHALKTDIERKEETIRQVGELYKAIEAVEKEIRMNAKFETAVVFGRDGRKLLDKRGQARSVAFTAEECRCMKDAIMTHNHPSGWSYPGKSIMRMGNSFSKEDISLAVRYNLSEVRAVTPIYTFVLKRPEEGWEITSDRFREIYKTVYKSVREETDTYVEKMEYSTLSCDRANVVFFHKINKQIARMLGWKYSKRRN